MTTESRNTLYQWFSKGMKPLASQFKAWIDSFWHKDDEIPASSIKGLQDILDSKPDNEAMEVAISEAKIEMEGYTDDAANALSEDIRELRQNLTEVLPKGSLTPDLTIVDEIAKTHRHAFSSNDVLYYNLVSINRPKNYIVFTNTGAELFLPIVEMKWKTPLDGGATQITSKRHFEPTAALNVEQQLYSNPGPGNPFQSTDLDVYTPIAQSDDERIVICKIPVDRYVSGELIEYDIDGNVIVSTSFRDSQQLFFGRIIKRLEAETVAIRVQSKHVDLKWRSIAIYVNRPVWSQYMMLEDLTGLYRMSDDVRYDPFPKTRGVRFIDKARKRIATMGATSRTKYAVTRYYPPIEDVVTIRYGAAVTTPTKAVSIAAGHEDDFGVFVKMKARRTLSPRYEGSRRGKGRSFQKWNWYKGFSSAESPKAFDEKSIFPSADDAWENNVPRKDYYLRPLKGHYKKMEYVDCIVSYVEKRKYGKIRIPVGPSMKFRIRSVPVRHSRNPTTATREWMVVRA